MEIQIPGLTLTFGTKATPAVLDGVSSRGTWWPVVKDWFPGAWQQNLEARLDNVITYSTVFACVSLIMGDIAKMRIKLVQHDDDVWSEVQNSAFSPFLRKPNRIQNRIFFIMSWLASKLLHGNTYVLKVRDDRQVVTAGYVLDPQRVRTLVSPDGAVFYALSQDNLSALEVDRTVPAREIIHDLMYPLFHPLVGVSPISACGLAAVQGLKIQNSQAVFFNNHAQPGGILAAPGPISTDNAQRIEDYWEANYSGDNAGKVAVLGDGMKFERMTVNQVDAQLIDQLKWTGETICSCFHVPPYMVGIGDPPNYNNIEALNQQYYSQCLQILIEALELCLDEGLGLGAPPNQQLRTEFDLEDLLRMDTATRTSVAKEQVQAGFLKPNEARAIFNRKPVTGGDTCYMQQQDFSLAALDARDRNAVAPGGEVITPELDREPDVPDEDIAASSGLMLTKALAA